MKRLILLTLILASSGCSKDSSGSDASPECVTYCDVMSDNCPSTFDDVSDCVETCDEYPSEPEDIIGDGPNAVEDNTVECRIYHAGIAAADPDGTHCTIASAAGGGVCVDFKGICADYCGTVIEPCAQAEGAYVDIDDCENACNSMAQGNVGEESGDTAHCRFTFAQRVVDNADPSLCESALRDSIACQN